MSGTAVQAPDGSPDHPFPVRAVAVRVAKWIDRLGIVWVEGQLTEIKLRSSTAYMVLRDPATIHLMLHEVVRCLEACVASESVPKRDPQLRFITRLLTVAVGGREMLQEGVYYLPGKFKLFE